MEPIIGYRAWIFKDNYLYSPFYIKCGWTFGRPLKFKNYSYESGFEGIYAFKTKEFLKKEFRDKFITHYIPKFEVKYDEHDIPISSFNPTKLEEYLLIRGEVYLWGKIVEHEFGYRAEFAYPKKLYKHKNLAQKYGCEF